MDLLKRCHRSGCNRLHTSLPMTCRLIQQEVLGLVHANREMQFYSLRTLYTYLQIVPESKYSLSSLIIKRLHIYRGSLLRETQALIASLSADAPHISELSLGPHLDPHCTTVGGDIDVQRVIELFRPLVRLPLRSVLLQYPDQRFLKTRS